MNNPRQIKIKKEKFVINIKYVLENNLIDHCCKSKVKQKVILNLYANLLLQKLLKGESYSINYGRIYIARDNSSINPKLSIVIDKNHSSINESIATSLIKETNNLLNEIPIKQRFRYPIR